MGEHGSQAGSHVRHVTWALSGSDDIITTLLRSNEPRLSGLWLVDMPLLTFY